jgi:hypothetical protein
MAACLSRVGCGFQIGARQCYLKRPHETSARRAGQFAVEPGLSASETRAALPADPVRDFTGLNPGYRGGLPQRATGTSAVPGGG